MMQLPNGLFYELEDLSAEVQERAIESFLEGHRKIIRAMIRQRQRDVQTLGLMWMIHCRDIATYDKMQKQRKFSYPVTWRGIFRTMQYLRKWERDRTWCRKVIISNVCIFTAEGEFIPIYNYDD